MTVIDSHSHLMTEIGMSSTIKIQKICELCGKEFTTNIAATSLKMPTKTTSVNTNASGNIPTPMAMP